MNKLKETISASLLCLKYPFLYPRNIWDGKHHAYILNSKLYDLNKEAVYEFGITAAIMKKQEKLITHAEGHGATVDLDIEKRKLIIKNHLETKELELKRLLWNSDDKFEVLGMTCFWNNSKNITIYVRVNDENDKTNYGFGYDYVKLLNNKRKLRYYKILKWIDLNIFDNLFFLPTYTELDAMEPGWRKAFGLQMCEEIKQELKRHKGALKRYRITQIKEKFGGLRWYDNYSTEKIWKEIIPKYTQLSYKTCIHCGKPAKYISKGWISPYCEDCAKQKEKYVEMTKNGAWDKALCSDLSFLNDIEDGINNT